MNLITNGAFVLGLVYLISGIIAVIMSVYFLFINSNGLRSILCHLFFSWSGHYITVGTLTFAAYILGHEVVDLNTLRLIAAVFVVLQFTALIRLYKYIKKNYGHTHSIS